MKILRFFLSSLLFFLSILSYLTARYGEFYFHCNTEICYIVSLALVVIHLFLLPSLKFKDAKRQSDIDNVLLVIFLLPVILTGDFGEIFRFLLLFGYASLLPIVFALGSIEKELEKQN